MSSGVVFSRLSSLFNLLQTAPHKKKPILLLTFIMFKRLFGNPSSSSASGRPSSSSSKGGGGSGSTTSGRAAFDAVDKLKDVSRVLGGFDFRSFVRSFFRAENGVVYVVLREKTLHDDADARSFCAIAKISSFLFSYRCNIT